MTSMITSPTYDPKTTATSLAQQYMSAADAVQTAQQGAADATKAALFDLGNALQTFNDSMVPLTGITKTLSVQSASLSDNSIGSATANASVAAGSYSFFVKQIATASQVSYSGLTNDVGYAGQLVVNLGGGVAGGGHSINVDLGTADSDKNGCLSVQELAAAINGSSSNQGLLSAAVISTGMNTSGNATYELVLSANNTGTDNVITLDTSGVTGPSINGVSGWSLAAANADSSRSHTLVAAQNAEIQIGAAGGTSIIQDSNTFTNLSGLKMTFTKAQATNAAPLTVTVATDTGATNTNVTAFVTAYNTLRSTLDAMLDPGDPGSGTPAGAFANDAGVRALRDSLVNLLRPNTSGTSLAAYGITSVRNPTTNILDGTLGVDPIRLAKQLALDPHGLDTVVGSSSLSASAGIAGAINKLVNSWTVPSIGQIATRQTANKNVESSLSDKKTQLDDQYNTVYQRYLAQFAALQVLQSQMTQNSSMFAALFSNDSKS